MIPLRTGVRESRTQILMKGRYGVRFDAATTGASAAMALAPVKGPDAALKAWVEQWLADPADTAALVAQRERFAALRRVEEPGWNPPTFYVAPEGESFLADLPAPPKLGRAGRGRSKGRAHRQQHKLGIRFQMSTEKVNHKQRGERIRAARIAAGWGEYGGGQALAAAVGFPGKYTLLNIERGLPSAANVEKVITFLGINREYLRTGQGEMLIGTPPTPPPHGKAVTPTGGKPRRKKSLADGSRTDGPVTEWGRAVEAVEEAKRALDEAKENFSAATKRLNELMGADV